MKKISKWILLTVMSVSAFSCFDLKEEVFNSLVADNYYTSKKAVESAVNRIYEHGQWCFSNDRFYLNELTADQFVWTQKGKHGWDEGNWVNLHRHTWTVRQGQINGGWVGPFQGIGQVNTVLTDFDMIDINKIGLTQADIDSYKGELYALRAWYYMYLIDFFRWVPIVEDTYTIKEQDSPQDVFAFIEKDLKAAAAGLPIRTAPSHFNKCAAQMLLARLYLNAQVWTGVDRSADAAKIYEDVIAGAYGGYQIDSDYRGPFTSGVGGRWSPENIFELAYAQNILNWGWMWDAFAHYRLGLALGNSWGGWNGIHLSPSYDISDTPILYSKAPYNHTLGTPYQNFLDGDYRKQNFRTTAKQERGGWEGFFYVGQLYKYNADQGFGYTTEEVLGGEEWSDKPLKFVDQVGRFSEKPNGRWGEGSKVETGEENSGVRFLKFAWLPEPNRWNAGWFAYQSAVVVRLSEAYFYLAEIEYKKGNKARAAELIDKVIQRNYPADMWAKVSYVMNPSRLTDEQFLREMGCEFIGENRRRQDLVRWDKFTGEWWDHKAYDKNSGPDRVVFPIPQNQLEANPLLKQTTRGW